MYLIHNNDQMYQLVSIHLSFILPPSQIVCRFGKKNLSQIICRITLPMKR